MNTQDGCTQNWPEVKERLSELVTAETTAYVRTFVIQPLLHRFDSGERSNALAEEIMAVSL